jgi:type IV secretory pathway VirB6-like protein
MAISQGGKIYVPDILLETLNRTGFVQYYGITDINRTSSLEQEYNFKYYSTDIGNYRTIYP